MNIQLTDSPRSNLMGGGLVVQTLACREGVSIPVRHSTLMVRRQHSGRMFASPGNAPEEAVNSITAASHCLVYLMPKHRCVPIHDSHCNVNTTGC